MVGANQQNANKLVLLYFADTDNRFNKPIKTVIDFKKKDYYFFFLNDQTTLELILICQSSSAAKPDC